MSYGNQKLPQTMDADKVKDLILEYQKTGNVNARNIVVETNLRLVAKIAWQFLDYYDIEELINVGVIGMIKCIDDYDASMGTKFSTVATKYVYTAIRNFVHNQRKYSWVDSLDRIISDEDKIVEDDLYDTSINIVLDYEKKEQAVEVRKIVENLPDRKRQIIELYFGLYGNLPLKEREIAKIVGVTDSRVGQLKRRALEMLKPQFVKKQIVESAKIK